MTGEKDDQPDFGSTGHQNHDRHAATDSLSPQPHQNEEEVSILDILIVLAKHKKLILGLPFLAAIITAGITLLMPNWYTGTAKILPPQQSQSNAVAILGQLGALAGGATQAFGIKNPNDVFVAMLKSRTVADSLIGKFDLKTIYGKELMTDVRKSLARNTSITSGKDGVIAIEVDDRDPKRAADLANAYVSQLEVLTLDLAISEAGKRRLFFEKQLQKSKEDLASAEVELQKSQESSGIINPAGQASLSVAAAAGLRARNDPPRDDLAQAGRGRARNQPADPWLGQLLCPGSLPSELPPTEPLRGASAAAMAVAQTRQSLRKIRALE